MAQDVAAGHSTTGPQLPNVSRPVLATHWGLYRARVQDGETKALLPFDGDSDPSPIADAMLGARLAPARVLRPAVRRSFLEKGHASGGHGRGAEPFVEVDWETAERIVADEIERVRTRYGNCSIYGGSYGWGSAGRFHHAQSHVHRFLNSIGGYTRSVQNYSFAAADVILPHVFGTTQGLASGHTPWSLISGHSKLIVMFGGMPHRNAQVSSGGIARHTFGPGVRACREAGARFVNISPVRDDAMDELDAEWLAIRPNTDTALMLGMAHTLIVERLHDLEFLNRYTVGFDRLTAYIAGESDGVAKSAEWAARITDIPTVRIRALAREMAGTRTLLTLAWALQRADHGEQPYWMAAALASMLGQIGLPGGGVGYGYASSGGVGISPSSVAWPAVAQGKTGVPDFIPVARVSDMLLNPGQPFDYNGKRYTYPDIRMVYWAGGNPFHHHQDINKLIEAWRRPECVVVNEPFWTACARHADIVLPVATPMERNDIAASGRDNFIAASHKLFDPPPHVRTDFEIFRGLAARLGAEPGYSEGRDEASGVRHLYNQAQAKAAAANQPIPDFETFWEQGIAEVSTLEPEPLLGRFRSDPIKNKLATPSGKIELYSERIASFGYDDCLGHPAWIEPKEWLGSADVERFPLHLMSNQPAHKLHSQYDHGANSRDAKVKGREPVRLHSSEAARRGLADGDIVRVFNDRGAVLSAVVVDDRVRPGVAQLSTGAWYDPLEAGRIGSLDKHGNPNVLTRDQGTSKLAQAPSANSCLVEIERYTGDLPEITCFDPPPFATRA